MFSYEPTCELYLEAVVHAMPKDRTFALGLKRGVFLFSDTGS